MEQFDQAPKLSDDEKNTIKRKLFFGSGIRVGGFIFNRLLLVIRIIIFARLFSPHDLGLFSIVISVVGFVTVLGNFGFKQNIMRHPNVSESLINTSYVLSWIFGVALVSLTWLLAPIFNYIFSENIREYTQLASLLVLVIPLQFPAIFWEKELDFIPPTIMEGITNVLTLAISVWLEIVWHVGVWSLLYGSVMGLLITSIYVWVRASKRPRFVFHKEELSNVFKFGSPFMLQSLNGQVMSRGDVLILGYLTNPMQVAFYNFAWQLPMLISTLTSTIEAMLLPIYGQVNQDRKTFERLFNLSNKIWSIAGAVGGFLIILYADIIVTILYGVDWIAAVPYLRIITISFILRFCTGYAYDNLALVRGRTAYLMKWGFVNTAFLLVIGYFLINKFGAIGGSLFWVLQAIILIPLIRFPLIYQEIGNLDFLNHIWQPILSGLIAFFIASLGDYWWPLPMWLKFSRGIVVFLLSFGCFMYTIDRRFYQDIWQITHVNR